MERLLSERSADLAIVADDQSLTWQDFHDAIDAKVAEFKANDFMAGDRIALRLPNSIEYLVYLFAGAKLGGITVAIDPATSERTKEQLLLRTSPRWVIEEKNESLKARSVPARRQHPNELDGSLVMFSSGSTGTPKGVPLHAEHFLSVFRSMKKVFQPRVGHRELILSPLVHMDGFQRAVLTLKSGGTLFLADGPFSPSILHDFISEHGINGLYLPPASVAPLAESKDWSFPESVDHVEVGSASHSPETLTRLQKKIASGNLIVHFGLTECSRATLVNLKAASEKIASVGRIENELKLRIVDSKLEDVPACKTGMILLKGEQTIERYWNGENAERFKDGWFLTHDFGWIDSDGYLYFAGREDDLMTRAGYHLYPAEVEFAIGAVDQVGDLCVVAVKRSDAPANDFLVAFYTSESDSADPKKIEQAIVEKLPGHMRPNKILRLDQLPRTSSGKIDRKSLREKASHHEN